MSKPSLEETAPDPQDATPDGRVPSSQARSEPLPRIDRYIVLGTIGEGAMGIVYARTIRTSIARWCMLNDILLGRATLEGEKRETGPFRAPGEVQTVACATCGAVVPASQASGTRCRRCMQPAPPAAPPVPEPLYDPALELALARDAQRDKGRSDVAIGLVLFVLGLVITLVTYDSASHRGGTYILAYGPIIFGVIRLIRGMARLGG